MEPNVTTPLPGRPLSHRAALLALVADPARRHRLLGIGALLALLIVALLSILTRLSVALRLDLWFTQEVQEHRWRILLDIMAGVSIFGSMPWALVTIGGGVLLVWLWLGWRQAGYLFAITVGQGLINAAIKSAIGRPRPIAGVVDVFVPEQGYSFPSGHVMFYTVFFGFFVALILLHLPPGRLRLIAAAPPALLVLLVGPSRIFLGAHWLSDVVAAYLLGFTILAFAIEGFVRFAPQLRDRSPALEVPSA